MQPRPPKGRRQLPNLDETDRVDSSEGRELWQAYCDEVQKLEQRRVERPLPAISRPELAVPFSPRLDLHGMSEAEAHAALTMHLEAASELGVRTVMVITGRGRQGKGVLKAQLPGWLEAMPGDSVRAWQPAPQSQGGEGALLIRLRKRQKPVKERS